MVWSGEGATLAGEDMFVDWCFPTGISGGRSDEIYTLYVSEYYFTWD